MFADTANILGKTISQCMYSHYFKLPIADRESGSGMV